MRDIDTKIDNTAPSATGRLSAAQFNSLQVELEAAVTTTGIALDLATGPDTDARMLAQAMAKYASGGVFGIDSGAINTMVFTAVSPFVAPKALFRGMRIIGYPGGGNNSTATVNAFGLGIKPLLDHAGVALVGGETTANRLIEIVYDPLALSSAGAWKLAPWANQLLFGASSVINNTYTATLPYAQDTGTVNHIVCSFSPAITSLAAGNIFEVRIANANTGATDFKANALTAVPVTRLNGAALRVGDIVAGQMALLLYDGTNAQIINPIQGPVGLHAYGSPQVYANAVHTYTTQWSNIDRNTFSNSTFSSGAFTVGAGEAGLYLVSTNYSNNGGSTPGGAPHGVDIWYTVNDATAPGFNSLATGQDFSTNNDIYYFGFAAGFYLNVGDVLRVGHYWSAIGLADGATGGRWTDDKYTNITIARISN